MKNSDDIDLKNTDCAIFLTPHSNVQSFAIPTNEQKNLCDNILIDNSRFVNNVAIELSDLLSKTDNVDDPNDKIHDNTDIFVNKKYYNELIHMIGITMM